MGYRSMRPSLFLLTLLLAGCTSSAISVSSSLSSSTTSVGSSVTSSSTSSIPDDYPFTPGERGSVPVDPALVPISGQFGGLYIEQMDHQPYFYGEGTRAEAVLRFPEPYEIEATKYRLQTYATSTSSWVNYGEGDDFLLDYDNCIVPAINEQRFRLLVIGGPRDGDVSNEVVTSYPTVETQFMGYYLDESMSLTGIMSPFVGRGLEASFPVKSHATGLEVTTGLNYQWYRVNPFTYAHTPIAGATALSYTTTMADLGFYIAIIATGDGVNVGGSYEVISRGNPIMLPVATFVTDGTSTSF